MAYKNCFIPIKDQSIAHMTLVFFFFFFFFFEFEFVSSKIKEP